MTNEELVLLIQSGERDKLSELWTQVERFVAKAADHRLMTAGHLGGVEFEDLYQSGYIALVAAADTYSPDAGTTFISWLALSLKTAFAEAGGYRSRKQKCDPLHTAYSLDMPIGDNDSPSLADTVEDSSAAQAIQDTENRVWQAQLHTVMEHALERLPASEATALRLRYYSGLTRAQIGDALGVSPYRASSLEEQGLIELRRCRYRDELEQFISLRTNYYLRASVKRQESPVEILAIKREEWRAQCDAAQRHSKEKSR